MKKGLKILFWIWVIWLLLESTQILGIEINRSGFGVYALIAQIFYLPFLPIWIIWIIGFLIFFLIGKSVYNLENERKWPKTISILASILLILQPLILFINHYLRFFWSYVLTFIKEFILFLITSPLQLIGVIVGISTIVYIFITRKKAN